MIVVTGAAGFIASCLISKLNELNYNDLILVDDFSKVEKIKNYTNKKFTEKINREFFTDWLDINHKFVEFIFHLGARSDTTEFDWNILNTLNTEYTKVIWRKCSKYGIPLIYASSAATYGNGNMGFDDSVSPNLLSPLNLYGKSKNDFDKWSLVQLEKPYFHIGLKFFNVYGPNEYHKANMASVIFHAFNQINENKELKLFKSDIENIGHGEQKRDFIYVKDVVNIMIFFMNNRNKNFNGIYNIGTGTARTFNELAKATFSAMNLTENIKYVEMPENIKNKYQYFTEAKITKLRNIGYNENFYSLEDGIFDYINNYLKIPQNY